jgi:hypothetical protein
MSREVPSLIKDWAIKYVNDNLSLKYCHSCIVQRDPNMLCVYCEFNNKKNAWASFECHTTVTDIVLADMIMRLMQTLIDSQTGVFLTRILELVEKQQKDIDELKQHLRLLYTSLSSSSPCVTPLL